MLTSGRTPMSSGAMTSTMAGDACFSWAAISRLLAYDPLTVNSLSTTGFSVLVLAPLVVVVVVVVAVVVVVGAGGGALVACANAVVPAATATRNAVASRKRLGRGILLDVWWCMLG